MEMMNKYYMIENFTNGAVVTPENEYRPRVWESEALAYHYLKKSSERENLVVREFVMVRHNTHDLIPDRELLVDSVKQEVLSSISIDTEEMIERQVQEARDDMLFDIKEETIEAVKDEVEYQVNTMATAIIRTEVEDKMRDLTRDLRVAFKWEVE